VVESYIQERFDDLAGPCPTLIERTLASSITVSLLAVSHAEGRSGDSASPLAVRKKQLKRLRSAVHRLKLGLLSLSQVRVASEKISATNALSAAAIPRLSTTYVAARRQAV
jgi:hypothetical protein